jgi:hypothetical protein
MLLSHAGSRTRRTWIRHGCTPGSKPINANQAGSRIPRVCVVRGSSRPDLLRSINLEVVAMASIAEVVTRYQAAQKSYERAVTRAGSSADAPLDGEIDWHRGPRRGGSW